MAKIKFLCGSNIKSAHHILNEESKFSGDVECGDFNGKTLNSKMTLDEMYKLVTGKTKLKYDTEMQESIRFNLERQQAHKDAIPLLTVAYIKKGHKILNKTVWKEWDKCVTIRLGDLYQGMELNCTLEIVDMLDNQECLISEAINVFNDQEHSGMSAGLVISMIKTFSMKGNKFAEVLKAKNK